MDEINRAVELWDKERPDVDNSRTELVWRTIRLGTLFWEALDETLAPFGLKLRSYSVLAVLRTHGAPKFELPPKALLRATYLTTGGLTNLLTGMEKRGLVQRRDDPTDGRSILVRMTPKGQNLIDEAVVEVRQLEQRLASYIGEPDAEALTEMIRRFQQNIDGLAIGSR